MNTQHPTKDADPERPSGAEGFLPLRGFGRITANPFTINTYKISISNPFRMNAYEKTGGGDTPSRFGNLPDPTFYILLHSLHALCRSLPSRATHLAFFQSLAHSSPKNAGVSCRGRFLKRAVFAASSICRGRRLEVRDEEKNGQHRIAKRNEQIGGMNAMLRIKNDRRNKISDLLQNADQHQRPETHRIRCD